MREIFTLTEKILAYTSKGKPLTIESYNANLQEVINDYKAEKTISQKEMEKKIKTQAY